MFVTSLPKDLLDELVQGIDDFPDMEEGWSRMRVLRMASWGRGVTQEQVENEQREEACLLRRGVELARAGQDRGGVGRLHRHRSHAGVPAGRHVPEEESLAASRAIASWARGNP